MLPDEIIPSRMLTCQHRVLQGADSLLTDGRRQRVTVNGFVARVALACMDSYCWVLWFDAQSPLYSSLRDREGCCSTVVLVRPRLSCYAVASDSHGKAVF
jgi:hypothetical protein